MLWSDGRVQAVEVVRDGKRERVEGAHFISTMPIRELIGALRPAPPELEGAALDFNYRDFLTVALMVRGSDLFPDNWIYVHDPNVKVKRVFCPPTVIVLPWHAARLQIDNTLTPG